MKNRLSTISKSASWMLVLLAACGVTSCKDEYKLDDEKPSTLSSSIYSSLDDAKNYTYYLRLLGDADVNPLNARPLTEVLSRTGSKTVFVADDEAWEEFFKKNATLPETDPWHTATSYENLSVSQKKLLIHTSMLNNAIVMENLASNLVDGTMTRGEFMRRYTDVEVTDSITYVDPASIPVNYNVGNNEKDYWWRFRAENGGNGLYMVNDSSLSMMVHFTNEHMKKNNVTDEDFAVFMNEPRNTEDVHIYGAKLIEKDGVCENGYVNKTSKVIAPLPNMAEMIRTNGETKIFSHMLDRWSVPFFNRGVTNAYKDVMAARGITWEDSIFTKRYFSDMSWGHTALGKDPNGMVFADAKSTTVSLKFDPGWNGYYNEKASPQYDMAAMYVPNDETLWKYFTEGGGGWQLIQTYYMKVGQEDEIPYTKPETLEDLYKQIDQIPISTLRSLLNLIMFNSFVSSVPSKMTQLREAVTQEQIFYPEDRDRIKKCLLANNGIIYITDKVYGPADYTSVAAPAYISGTNLVMRWAIYNGSSSAESDYMKLSYYAYLKAMQSKFVYLLPSDEGLRFYYDPLSFRSKRARMLSLKYNEKKKAQFPIEYTLYDYDPTTATIQGAYAMEKVSETDIVNRLKDILESHTIVLEELDEINSDVDEYYLAKNGSAIKVTREIGEDGLPHIVKVQGGYQLENESEGLTGSIDEEKNKGKITEMKGVQYNEVTDEHNMTNGTTYILDSPIIPSAKSVFNNLTNNKGYNSEYYSNFYDYCCTADEAIVRACGLVDELNLNTSAQKAEAKKFMIFSNMIGSSKANTPDYDVQFFNNYNYTIFVPTNEAMDEAVANGLPTWESITEYYNNNLLVRKELQKQLEEKASLAEGLTEEEAAQLKETIQLAGRDSIYLQAQITYLTNFARNHFADNSVFVDKSNFESTEYVTASYDNVKGLFCKLNVKRNNGELSVQDVNGGKWLTIGGRYNVMARDIVCNNSPEDKSSMNGITIDGSSFAVIHQIPGVLNHTELVNGRHDSTWASVSEAKKYLKRFAIH